MVQQRWTNSVNYSYGDEKVVLMLEGRVNVSLMDASLLWAWRKGNKWLIQVLHKAGADSKGGRLIVNRCGDILEIANTL